ncbi:MAG TPA: hypothetical protein VK099_03310 [Alcanivoracaceae bacterium]|nr:hypothetical protein [Alcanivoracaceae bacterium]
MIFISKPSVLALLMGAALATTGCGGNSSSGSTDAKKDPSPTTPTAGEYKVKNIETTAGDNNTLDTSPTISAFTAEDGRLGLRINGVDKGDGTVEKPRVRNLKAEDTTGTPAGVETADSSADEFCTELKTGEAGSGDMFDIVVSLDTTGSMGSHAKTFAEKIVAFAGALEEQGLDVRFAGVTLGDAFATKETETEKSSYTSPTAKGSLGTPPDFDDTERPDTGLALISAEDMQSFFSEVAEKVGSGLNGGDGPENYLAPIDYFNDNAKFREDAGRFFVAIGDNCAHTGETLQNTSNFKPEDADSHWLPRSTEDITTALINEGVAVNLIWSARNCFSPFFDMKDLQESTGGSWTNIAGDVELTTLPAIDAVGAKRSTLACAMPVEKKKDIKVTFDIEIGEDTELNTWHVTMLF